MSANVIEKSTPVTVSANTAVFDLPKSMAALFDELSNVKYTKLEAEKREKEIKQQILAQLPATRKGVKYVLRVKGVIRASVSHVEKTLVNGRDLLDAFPEAYEACSRTTTYDVMNPA